MGVFYRSAAVIYLHTAVAVISVIYYIYVKISQ